MSAITGIFYRDGSPVSVDQIKKMNECISHRGPDGQRFWVEGPVALGHQMLYTTPESLQEKLPFHDKSLNMVITADARIDNRDELSLPLNLQNKTNIPDSYFILKAYQKWGDNCLDKLLGDFSFAIWDVNNKKLFCARDHMGVKPFYYYLSDDVFVFSTEIKALFSSSVFNKKINELMVAYHLQPFYDDKEITYYEDVYRLPDANFITVENKKTHIKRYWKLDPNKETKFKSDEDYVTEFRRIFFEAVNCRMRSVQNVGSFMSGGLDSSSITCVAKNILKNRKKDLNTFSAIFPDIKKSDESTYIKSVLEDGIEPHFVIADKISPLKDAQRILWHGDMPYYGPNRFIHYSIYDKAQKSQVRVILDGIDGDTVISYGYRMLTDLAKSMHWFELLQEINALSKRTGKKRRQIFWGHVFIPVLPEILKKIFLRDIWNYYKGTNHKSNHDVINPNFYKHLDLSKMVKHQEISTQNLNERELHYLSLQKGIHQVVFEGLDHSAASFQIEPRYPFFDKRMVEFCLSLPSRQKFNKGWDRIILRRAMDNILPKKIQWRKQKSKLGYNFDYNFLNFEKNTIEEMITDKYNILREFVDLQELKKCYERYKSDLTENSDIMMLWNSVTLYLWLKQIYKK